MEVSYYLGGGGAFVKNDQNWTGKAVVVLTDHVYQDSRKMQSSFSSTETQDVVSFHPLFL